MSCGLAPVPLAANQPPRFYRGGAAIAALRGTVARGECEPEDWVASTTTLAGEQRAGLSTLPDGRLLRDAITAAPEAWLGSAHVAAYGADPALLVKLLDAGERLPVHCHPPDGFARTHLGSARGKTEAWVVVGATGSAPAVHVGFATDIDEDTLARWVAEQDGASMLAALNTIGVQPGDTVLVPAGVPHAIGAGVFVVEVQQPTDLSLLLEWRGFLPDQSRAHLDLGFDVALGCVDRSAWSEGRLAGLLRHGGATDAADAPLLPDAAEEFFRVERLRARRQVALDASFAVLVVLDGAGRLATAHGAALPLHRGDTVVVPYGAGEGTIDGDVTAVRCLPPSPAAPKA